MFQKPVYLRLVYSTKLWIPKVLWPPPPFLTYIGKMPGKKRVRIKWEEQLFDFCFLYLLDNISWIDADFVLVKSLFYSSPEQYSVLPKYCYAWGSWIFHECFSIWGLVTFSHSFRGLKKKRLLVASSQYCMKYPYIYSIEICKFVVVCNDFVFLLWKWLSLRLYITLYISK